MSNTIVVISARLSRKLEPFTSTPIFDAAPMPPKKPSGTEITSAQGQDTIRKIQARFTHPPKGCPRRSGGISARSAAHTVTAGVYHRAKRVMKFSRRAFFSLAVSTSSRIFATVESS